MKLILFCDYGLDDAVATVDALSHAISDGYEEVVLVAIGGNVPSEVSLRNAQTLVTQCNFPIPPVLIVDTTGETQPSEYLADIHGGDGMGDLFAPTACDCPIISFSQWLSSFTGEYDLLSLGPMTLVPRLLQKTPCRKFIFMCGNIAEEPNFHGYEFNHALDRNAFSAVVKEYPHIGVTMDTCREELLNVQNKVVEGHGFIGRLVARAREMTFHSGEKGSYIWDDIAVKVLRHPEWFTYSTRVDKDGNAVTVAKYCHGKEYLQIIED